MADHKIKLKLDDPDIKKIWDTALEARREVAAWPAWKRGEIPQHERQPFDPVLVDVLARLIIENQLHVQNREDTIGVLMRCGAFLAVAEAQRDGFVVDLASAIDERAAALRTRHG